jgi:hypothetical protein
MGKLIFFGIIAFAIFRLFVSDETGCETYASRHSCDYVLNKATYDVYYWFNVSDGDPQDEKLIGNATGLPACRDLAVNYANKHNQRWNNRSYICVLVKDGDNLEKHRY